jgi:hypothetical protein
MPSHLPKQERERPIDETLYKRENKKVERSKSNRWRKTKTNEQLMETKQPMKIIYKTKQNKKQYITMILSLL